MFSGSGYHVCEFQFCYFHDMYYFDIGDRSIDWQVRSKGRIESWRGKEIGQRVIDSLKNLLTKKLGKGVLDM